MNIVERIAIGMLEAIFAPFREFLKLLVALIMGLIGALLLPIRVGGLVDDFQSKLEILSLEEAITQMELLGHDFFIFKNEDNIPSVLYLREDGKYGLIETE